MDQIELYEKIVAGTNQGVLKEHRLFAELHDSKRVKEILRSPIYQTYLKDLNQTAQRMQLEEINVLPWRLFKGFDTTGNRIAYEGAYFEHRGRLMTFALKVWLYHKPEDIEALEDIIWAICEEYTWCLPAHMNSKSLESESTDIYSDGKLIKEGFNPEIIIDLFAAETAFALAEIFYMLEGHLSPLIVHRGKKEVFRRVLRSYLDYPGVYNWEKMKNNWCAVCAGSIGVAGIYLIEEDAVLAQLLARLSPTLERFLDSFEADGTCLEGLSYFTYGVSFYVAFADLLKKRTAGEVDLLKLERFEKIAAFQHKCYFKDGWTVSFSDANQKDQFRSGLTSYLKKRFKTVEMLPKSFAAGYLSDPCFRWCNGIRDLLWTDQQLEKETTETTYDVLEDAQWMLCKQYSGHCFGLAVKGGHNDEPHNHNDVGSFIFYKDGDCLLTDLGCGEYTKDYFGAGRYGVFCNSSFGHSVPIIDGKGQKAGKAYRANETVFEGGCRMTMDISAAYGNQDLLKLTRDITFIEGEGVFLSDTFKIAKKTKNITERLITLYEPVIKPGEVMIKGEKTTCSIRFNKKMMTPTVKLQDYRDHKGLLVTVYCIDFDVVVTGENIVCKFEIR